MLLWYSDDASWNGQGNWMLKPHMTTEIYSKSAGNCFHDMNISKGIGSNQIRNEALHINEKISFTEPSIRRTWGLPEGRRSSIYNGIEERMKCFKSDDLDLSLSLGTKFREDKGEPWRGEEVQSTWRLSLSSRPSNPRKRGRLKEDCDATNPKLPSTLDLTIWITEFLVRSCWYLNNCWYLKEG